MGQSYRLVQTLRSGKTHPHVTARTTQEIRYVFGVSASNRITLADAFQGTVVRLAPNLLSKSDPQMLPKVYHRSADKSEFYIRGVTDERAPTVQTLGHQEHAARRKIIAPSVCTVYYPILGQKNALMMWKFSYR